MASSPVNFRQSSEDFQQQVEISLNEFQIWSVFVNQPNKSFQILQMLISEHTV